MSYMNKGLDRDTCLAITGLTKNQFYYTPTGTKKGKVASKNTPWRDPSTQILYEISNEDVVDKIVALKLDPDQTNWYRMISVNLNLQGFYINHKKVYRLMKEYQLLELPRKKVGRTFVKYRRVNPGAPLRVLEMDIKYVYVSAAKKYAFVLTVIDTFTRYVLHWTVGYRMRSEQVRDVWEYVISQYLQPANLLTQGIDIEIRNDNGKQFTAKKIMEFFKENKLNQVFTHPYTPEENGHVESFHSIIGKSMRNDNFESLKELEHRLAQFYTRYNNDRNHGSTLGVPPAKFWSLHELDKIKVIPLGKRRTKFKLKVALQDVLTLPEIDKYKYPLGSLTATG